MSDTPPPDAAGVDRPRPYIGVQFECCAVYYRVYRNAAGTAYEGRCPRCGIAVKVPIGPEGTTARFFRAG